MELRRYEMKTFTILLVFLLIVSIVLAVIVNDFGFSVFNFIWYMISLLVLGIMYNSKIDELHRINLEIIDESVKTVIDKRRISILVDLLFKTKEWKNKRTKDAKKIKGWLKE